ncbi:MAG: hypothetical protein FJW34_17760 [Acidobacteria bacterium]|nr:hypothetical protein [Acidobacteriota bacterium]
MNESLLLRFRTEDRPVNVIDFKADDGVVFDWHRDASPLNLALGLQPVFPGHLDPVRRRRDWRNKEFALDAVVHDGGLRLSGFRGDPEGLPAGVYDLTVEVESMEFKKPSERIEIPRGGQHVETFVEEPETRTVSVHENFDSITAQILNHPRSSIEDEQVLTWLRSERPRPARKACLLNILAKLRVPPERQSGLTEPLARALDFLYFADVDRIYAAAQPALLEALKRLTAAKLWVEEGYPAASIHRRLIDSLGRFGIPAADAARYELVSYRQGGRNCLQICAASPPEGCGKPEIYLDIDMDLGNPLWDLEGLIVHLGELLDPGRTDHLALHRALNQGATEDFLYYDVVRV